MRKHEAIQHRPEGDLSPEQAEEVRRLEAMGEVGIDTDRDPACWGRPGGTPGARR